MIFLGPPGAGKGTQAARLAAHLGVPRISTGDMLRDAIAKDTPGGREAQPLVAKGNLAPDRVIVDLVRARIAEPECVHGFVLDGFPRTLPQAEGLEQMMGPGARGWVVFLLEVPREELLARLSGRRWCPACQATYHVPNHPPRRSGVCDRDGTALVQRADDRRDVIAERLREYEARTAPLVDYYRTRARLVRIDGNRPMDQVFQDLIGAAEVAA